jgi:ATP-dependent helicase/nuclease subunit B
MSIRLLCGPNRKSITKKFIDEINEKISSKTKSRLIVIIPEQFSSYYEEILAMDKGLMKAEVMTFRRLTQRLFDIRYVQKENAADNAGKMMLLYKVLNAKATDLKYYGRSRSYPDFAYQMKNVIEELKKSGITPDELSECAKKDRISASKREKFSDIAYIYGEYLKELADKTFTDESDGMTNLCDHISETDRFDRAVIWFDRFSYFTVQEFNVIKRLMQKADTINISLCVGDTDSEQQDTVFYRPMMTRKKIMDAGKELNIPFIEEIISDSEDEAKCIGNIYRNYFLTKPAACDGADNVKIYKALDIYDEIEYTAISIMENIRDRGMRFKDMLVVIGNNEEYSRIASSVFDQYDIPYYLNRRKKITENPLIMYVIAVLELYTDNFSYEAVCRLIKNKYSFISEEEAFLLENYLIKWGIQGKGIWNKEWNYEKSEEDYIVNKLKMKITGMFNGFHDCIRGGVRPKAFVTGLYDVLDDLGIYERISKDISSCRDINENEETKQCYNSLMDLFNQMVLVIEDSEHSAEYYLNILKSAFMEKTVGVTPMTNDCVFISGTARTDVREYEAVYMIGVNDGIFPVTVKENFFFSDDEINFLHESGFDFSMSTVEQEYESDYLIYNLLQLSNKYLYLSYSVNNSEGAFILPSAMITRVKELMPEVVTISRNDIQDEDYVYNLKTAFNYLFNHHDDSIGDVFKDNDLGRLLLEHADTSGISDQEIAEKMFGNDLNCSASMLERYILCPYSFLMRYGIGIKERSTFSDFSAQLGTMKHFVISKVMKKIASENDLKEYTYDDIYGMCNDISDENAEIKRLFKRDHLLEFIQNRSLEQASNTIYESLQILKKEQLRPSSFEAGFGDNQDIPALVIDLDGKTVKLNGKIDRVDSACINGEEYFRIIDYKSADKDIALYKIKEGYEIQLALYAYVYHKTRNARLLGMYYMTVEKNFLEVTKSDVSNMSDEEKMLQGYSFEYSECNTFDIIDKDHVPDNRIVKSETADKIYERIGSLIKETGEEIYKGVFPVKPVYDKANVACRYCPYNNLCGFDPDKKQCRYNFVNAKKDDELEW